jgi:hypothetical protein
VVLNAVVANATKQPPLRVLLPEGSLHDYYEACYTAFPDHTGGLGLDPKRSVRFPSSLLGVRLIFGFNTDAPWFDIITETP